MDFKEKIMELLEQHNLRGIDLEIPPDHALGDYAFPCFVLARSLKQAPALIAKELATNLTADFLEKVEASGPYINFFIKPSSMAAAVLSSSQKELWGLGTGKRRVLIEYPSPNTNKPLHLGHVRNMALGSTLVRLFRADGNTVFAVNLNNDRGVHICKSMLAYQKWGNNSEPDKKSDHFVGDFYVKFKQETTNHPELEDEAQAMLLAWENNDPAVRALWEKMNGWALKGFEETYKRYNVRFDKQYYESEFYKEGKGIVEQNMAKFYVDDTGAVLAPLGSFGLQDKVLMRKDGTSIYITQDIALTLKKMEEFKPHLQIWVVGNEQILHFKQLFAILEILGTPRDTFHHLSYGLVALPDGRMKSREGRVVDADDILDELESLTKKLVKENHQDWSDEQVDSTGKAVAFSAIQFFMLKFDPSSDFTFNPDSSLSFEGDTGPYIQYTHARICSIIARTHLPSAADASLLTIDEEQILLRNLNSAREAFRKAVAEYKPSLIALQLIEIARAFNTFYHKCPVLQAAVGLREARLLLIEKTRETLTEGLSLLGIEALQAL